MKTAIVTLFLAAVILVSGSAIACDASYVSDIDLSANCDGWTACFTVEFVDDEMEADLDYGVTLLGDDSQPLEVFTVRVPIVREATGAASFTYCVEEIWEGYYDNPPFEVAVAAEICGTDAVGEIIEVDCVVANDEQTWDHIKSYYR